MNPETPTQPGNAKPSADPKFRCGTLLYTKAGLFTLFSWMLWGDFCFTLMESIWPNILPLLLSSEGASNVTIGVIMTTIPQAMNFILNPIISTASDRHRGKRGRRIPFLLMATPFVTFFLILMGFSRELGAVLHSWLGSLHPGLSQATVTVGLIGVLIIGFRFFELFINTVFWYLFNDVVPTAFMGRFLGFFRIVGGLAGAFFNFFIFQYAESHTSTIFLGVALLYGTAFVLLCLNVKEGEYPPPAEIKEKWNPISVVRTFLKECFGHRIFRLIFAYSSLIGASAGINTFLIFMAFSIGLTKDQVGKVAAVTGIVAMILSYPMGALVDRLHPLRVMLVSQIIYAVLILMQFIFLFHDFSKGTAFMIYATLAGIAIPVLAANAAASMPMFMRLFPHEKYGQFCAANAMCAALSAIIAGTLAGTYLDTLKGIFSSHGDYYYRFVPVWIFFFMTLAAGVTFLIFREWKKLGGDENYRPPIEDRFVHFRSPDNTSGNL